MYRNGNSNGKKKKANPHHFDKIDGNGYADPQGDDRPGLHFQRNIMILHIVFDVNAQTRMIDEPIVPTRIPFKEKPGSKEKKRRCGQNGQKDAENPQSDGEKA